MSVELNHTIVHARDNRESAEFFAGLLGLAITAEWGPFIAVELSNGVTLDFTTIPADRITPQHYAFLVDESEFDEILGRIRERGLSYWGDPAQTKASEINHHDGGRGVYFEDPNGHLLEVITRAYGSGGWNP